MCKNLHIFATTIYEAVALQYPSAWSSRIRWILIRDDVGNWLSARNISNLRIFRSENAKHSRTKKFIQIECIQTSAAADLIRDRYTRSSLGIWNRFYARVICTTAYIFIELQIAHGAGQFSRIFEKFGKNYRLRTARRIVQTPVGNLDKWRSSVSRPTDLLPSAPFYPNVIKKFRDQTAERGAMTWTGISLQTDFLS